MTDFLLNALLFALSAIGFLVVVVGVVVLLILWMGGDEK